MISWNLILGQPVAKQEFKRPVIYLDHWAVREISRREDFSSRFTTALKATGGTWAISLLNFIEYVPMTDESQAAEFEALMDRALPNLFFTDFQAFEVIARERDVLEGKSSSAPYGDVHLLKLFSENRPKTPTAFSATGLVTRVVEDRIELQDGFAGMKATGVERLHLLREQVQSNGDFEKLVSGSQVTALAQRSWFVIRELMRPLLLHDVVVEPNDVIDLFHAIVPLAYCDVVLLDKKWKYRADEMRKRVVEQNAGIELATVFAKPELEEFISTLEALTAST